MPKIIEVTYHALGQFRLRFPSQGGTDGFIRLLISSEVTSAFESGRYSSKQPRWVISHHRARGLRNGGEIDRTLRFVWTPDRRRMYLVDRRTYCYRVVTTLSPDSTIAS